MSSEEVKIINQGLEDEMVNLSQSSIFDFDFGVIEQCIMGFILNIVVSLETCLQIKVVNHK